MKIDYVIVSSDDNPMYLDFWDVIKGVWYDIIGIKPILVKIGTVDNVTDYGKYIIHEVKAVDGEDTGFQSQVIRMFIAKYYKEFNCLISDIDMLPISSSYFNDLVSEYENSMVIYSGDIYKGGAPRYPICYNVSSGKLFSDILDLDNYNFTEYCEMLRKRGEEWSTDELYFGECVDSYHDQTIMVKLDRGWSSGIADRRIDRVVWGYQKDLLKDYYIDSHLLRPYSNSNNKIIIDKLISEIYECNR